MKHKGTVLCLLGIAAVLMTGCVTTSPPPPAPTSTANVNEISRVTHDAVPEFCPRVSPDGKTLLFWVKDNTKQGGEALSIVSVSLSESGRKLVAGPYAYSPAWCPDGKSFVYSYRKTEKQTLVRSPFGGVGMTFVTPQPMGGLDSQPHVSPDGKKIAFQTTIGGKMNICTVNADGGNFTVYVAGFSPRWHPRENLIAFGRSVGKSSHIFLFDLNSGQVTQLTTGETKNTFPAWGPNGEWLAFASRRDGKWHLYAMKRDGSSVTQLTRGEAEEYTPEWSSDGWIYFWSNAGSPKATHKSPWNWTYSDIWRLKPALPQ
ncbi:MAG: TolB family protein [Planctomycetota bacterium]|jgi:TolB protein